MKISTQPRSGSVAHAHRRRMGERSIPSASYNFCASFWYLCSHFSSQACFIDHLWLIQSCYILQDYPLFWPEDESTYDDMITVQRLSANSSSVDNLKANYDQSEIQEKSFKATDLRVSIACHQSRTSLWSVQEWV